MEIPPDNEIDLADRTHRRRDTSVTAATNGTGTRIEPVTERAAADDSIQNFEVQGADV